MKRLLLSSALSLGIGLAGTAEAATVKIAFTIHSSPSNTFWQAVKKGFDDGCGKVQADCQMIFTQTEGSIEQQAANMQTAIAGKPDVLMTSIVDNNAFTSIAAGCAQVRPHRHRRQRRRDGRVRPRRLGRPLSARTSSPQAIRSGRRRSPTFPKTGRLHLVVGVSAPGQNWSEQRAAGIMKALQEFKAANPSRQIKIVRLDTGTDLAITGDRVGAYLNANQDVNAYFDTGFWHAAVARVLRDRGVPPGQSSSRRLRPRARGRAGNDLRLCPGAS